MRKIGFLKQLFRVKEISPPVFHGLRIIENLGLDGGSPVASDRIMQT
jgi:hypothetical protein